MMQQKYPVIQLCKYNLSYLLYIDPEHECYYIQLSSMTGGEM